MEVEITRTTKRKAKVKVTLPFYREHDCGGDNYEATYYTRVNEDLSAVSICKGFSFGSDEIKYEFEFEDKYDFQCSSDENYVLGRAEYALQEEDFYKILAEAQAKIDGIPKQ